MRASGYSMVEILGVVLLVLTLAIIAIPSLQNFREGGSESAAVRNVALLNSAIEQYDQNGGLMTAQVPVQQNVMDIKDTSLLPEMKVFNLLRNSGIGNVAAWQEPIFSDEGYRAIWVNDLTEEQVVDVSLGGHRNSEAEALIAEGKGGRFELLLPGDSNKRLGIVGFKDSSFLVTSSNNTLLNGSVLSQPTATSTPVSPSALINAPSVPTVAALVGVSPTPFSSPMPTPIASLSSTSVSVSSSANRMPTVTIAVSPQQAAKGQEVTFTATGADPDGDTLTYSFIPPIGTPTAFSPVPTYKTTFNNTGSYTVRVVAKDSKGATSLNASSLVVVSNRMPTVTLAASTAFARRGEPVTFTATGTDLDNDALKYSFNGGEYTTTKTFTTTYNTTGIKAVHVRVRDDADSSQSATATVTIVNRAPSVSLAVSSWTVARGQPVTFTAIGTDPDNDTLLYSFNGQAYTSERTFTTSYSTPGTKVVTVRVKDADDFSTLASEAVYVYNFTPVLSLTPSSTTVSKGSSVTFTARGTDQEVDPLQYSFNGGPFSSSSTFSKTFDSVGPQAIFARVTDGHNSSNASAVVNVISQTPTVSLSSSTATTFKNQVVTFTANGVSPDNGVLQYSFNGGPFGTANTFSTSYSTPGVKIVNVRVADGNNLSQAAYASVNIINRVPSTTLVASAPSVTRGQSVTFTATGRDFDNDNLLYSFNGGPFGTSRSFTTSYTTPGVKATSVRVSDGNSTSQAVFTSVIVADQPPTISLKANPSVTVRGANVTFSVVGATGTNLQYSFNNGPFGTASTFTTKYDTIGGKFMTVQVRDQNNTTRFATALVNVVNRQPVVRLTVNKTSAAKGEQVTFTATGSDADNDSLQYSFDGGPYSATNTFTESYTSAGMRAITVRAKDANDVSQPATAVVTIRNTVPTVSLQVLRPLNPSATTQEVYRGQQVTFIATGSDADNDIDLQYSFNGGPFGASRTFTTSYSTVGLKFVSVRVRDDNDVQQSPAVAVNVVNHPPSGTITASQRMLARGQPVTFTATGQDADDGSLRYSFNGGPFGTSNTFTTSYDTPGLKVVTLQVTDGNENSKVETATVVVENHKPMVSLSANTNAGVIRQPFTFTANGNDPDRNQNGVAYDTLQYSFNGGPFGTSNTFTTTYDSAGTKVVTVRVRDAYDMSSAVTTSVRVTNRLPVVSISASPSSAKKEQLITFTATGMDPDGEPLQYSFNGGPFGLSPTFTTTYNTLGQKTVTVRARDALDTSLGATAIVNITE